MLPTAKPGLSRAEVGSGRNERICSRGHRGLRLNSLALLGPPRTRGQRTLYAQVSGGMERNQELQDVDGGKGPGDKGHTPARCGELSIVPGTHWTPGQTFLNELCPFLRSSL